MAGGILQLVSKGNEDMYLSFDPQITFFRNVYKRHTNFSTESVIQDFKSKADFGKKITCTISKQGDLIGKTYVVVTLPKINYFQEAKDLPTLNKCAWVENIGWNIIKTVEIEIGGYVIDKHYGDWLFIWSELTRKNNNERVLNKMIGNVPELTDFSSSKDSYTLNIPLAFWFCNNPGLALPIVALEFTDVKINIEFAGINDVLVLAPTNYIDIENDVVQFSIGDILYQRVNNNINYIKFIDFQKITVGNSTINRLYYNKITVDPILSYSNSLLKSNYQIYSLNNNYYVNTVQNAVEMLHINKQKNFAWTNGLALIDAHLLIDFVYLDIDERIKFIKNNHEYLIDTLLFDNDKSITNNTSKIKLGYSHPCKELIFRARMDYLSANNVLQNSNYCVDYFKNSDIITHVQLVMNGNLRLSARSSEYFSLVQNFQSHSNRPPKGVYCYSFALNPEDHQPSGTCNLSKIDDLQLNVTVDKAINYANQARIRIYAVCINIFRIINGQGGLAFSN
jgi:hypothetical protein